MIANGANLRRKLANDDVAAVTAFPNRNVFGDEDHSPFNVFKKFFVAFFMVLLDFGDHAEFGGDFVEAFFVSDLGEVRIHCVPFIAFASSGFFEVVDCGFNLTALKIFEPHFCVFFFVVGGF